jgi:hypothetical protein
MMSAPECYEHAKHCEGLARAAEDAINRRMLEALASQWGILGDSSQPHAVKIA